MVRAICTFNKERAETMSKNMRKKTITVSIIISAVLLVFGVLDVITAFSTQEINYLTLGIGGILLIASPYPVFKTIKTEKENHRRTLEAMKLDKGEITFDYTIKDKKIELITTQAGVSKQDTMLIRNISYVKNHKDGLGIYRDEHLYYILNEEIVEGSKEELLRIFQNADIPIKNRK